MNSLHCYLQCFSNVYNNNESKLKYHFHICFSDVGIGASGATLDSTVFSTAQAFIYFNSQKSNYITKTFLFIF